MYLLYLEVVVRRGCLTLKLSECALMLVSVFHHQQCISLQPLLQNLNIKRYEVIVTTLGGVFPSCNAFSAVAAFFNTKCVGKRCCFTLKGKIVEVFASK